MRGGGRLVSLERRPVGVEWVEGRSRDDEDMFPGREREEVEDEAERAIGEFWKIEPWRRDLLIDLIDDSTEEQEEVEGAGEAVRGPIGRRVIGSSEEVSSR